MSYRRIRAPLKFPVPASYVAQDDFESLGSGVALATRAGWSGAGAAQDFVGDTSLLGGLPPSHVGVSRAAGDSGSLYQAGRFGILGSTNYGASAIQVVLLTTAYNYQAFFGGFLRYTAPNTNVEFLITPVDPATAYLYIIKNNGGVTTTLAYRQIPPLMFQFYQLTGMVDAAGQVFAWFGPYGTVFNLPTLVTQDSTLTSGALSSGKPGIYDRNNGVGTHVFDAVRAWVPSTDVAMYSGRQARFTQDAAYRQNSGGTAQARRWIEGENLWLPPATRAGRKSRLVVKVRRFDSESGMPDVGTTDTVTASLTATPRVALTSG